MLRSGAGVGLIFSLAVIVAPPARAQVLVETGVLSKKTKDLGDMIDKAMKKPNGGEPKVITPASKSGASARTKKPSVLPDTYNPDTEPPENVLDINTDVMTRFSAALASEVARRAQDKKPLTRAAYDSVAATAGSFTPRQYFVLKARVRPFCDAIAAGQPAPNDLNFSYWPAESAAIRPHCAVVQPELKEIPAK
jgi:hypothetical protein